MKKRILSIFLAIVLIAGICSGAGISFVKADSNSSVPDVALSVKTDKTDLRPGDEVKVTVSIDSFKSNIKGDTDPLISIYQVAVPIDTDIFEFVSKEGGLVKKAAVSYYKSEKKVKSAVSYNPEDEDDAKRIFKQSGDNATSELYSFTLKVKDDIPDNKTVSIDLDEAALILKNFNLSKGLTYAASVTPASVNIIAKEVSGIEISVKPDKTSYFTDSSTLDVTGGKIKVIYSNGTSEEVDMTSDMCSNVDLSTAGTKTVTVSYKGKTATFDVTVADKQIKSFDLLGVDNKKVTEGMKLDLAGITAHVTYDNGSFDDVAVTEDMLTYKTDKVGTTSVQVKIGNITKNFDITVEAKLLDSISMSSEPNTVNYVIGDRILDVTGAKITAIYNNGTKDTIYVTADMCSSVDFKTLGEKTVTVTYNGKITTFKINVVEKLPQSLKLNGVDNVSVLEGTKIDTKNMSADVTYNDGTVKNVAITEDMLTYSTDKAGETEVTVNAEGLTAKFTASVKAKKAVLVELKGTEGKSVTEGMKLDVSGITAEVTYDNGTKATVNVTEDMVAADTSKVGKATAKVTVEGVSSTFDYEVKAKELTGIVITSSPSKSTYLVGQKFSSDGLKAEAVYNNGTKADVTAFVKLSSVDMAKAGTQKVTVTYTENKVSKTAEFDVVIKTREAIEVFNKSVKKLTLKKLTKDDADAVKALRASYEALSDVEKTEVDVVGLEKLESTIKELTKEDEKTTEADDTNATIDDVKSETTDKDDSVKTGDIAPIMAMIAMLIAGAGMFCIVMPKRKINK